MKGRTQAVEEGEREDLIHTALNCSHNSFSRSSRFMIHVFMAETYDFGLCSHNFFWVRPHFQLLIDVTLAFLCKLTCIRMKNNENIYSFHLLWHDRYGVNKIIMQRDFCLQNLTGMRSEHLFLLWGITNCVFYIIIIIERSYKVRISHIIACTRN